MYSGGSGAWVNSGSCPALSWRGRVLPCPLPTPNRINYWHISPGVGSFQDLLAPITQVTDAKGPQVAMATETAAGECLAVSSTPPPLRVHQPGAQLVNEPSPGVPRTQ